ncbi:polysaccharide deacetylase family protein [Nocardioides marmotae]|uniref:polysaccharide deacetylase family protein n=1 Tax=Nocardioides marmotae TaxID=2663857 RepID=UPI0012B5FD83|nr:polysaccharide deacetylase family protein [Nocardioides marmotae]MBC9735627.1 polysaccharide deacetylase family protein [Nocardioides marmotae]MTB86723.1 polysaccharide deacetylase family protein [Nocardioides marmotae]
MRPGTRAVASVVRPVALARRSLATAPGLTVVGWHRVDGRTSDGLSTGIDDFRRHLDVLEEWGACVLPLAEAAARLRAGTLPDRAVALTFDDGYASVVETAWPLLRERGLATTLFVVSGILAGQRFAWDAHEPAPCRTGRLRPATAEELVAAADEGLDIGSHTVSHPWLPALDDDRLLAELVESRAVLEDLLGRPVRSLAYPTGGWDARVRAAAAVAGYSVGITVDRGLNTGRVHPLSLRRAFVPTEAADLRHVLDGAYTFLRPLDRWRSRGGPPW